MIIYCGGKISKNDWRCGIVDVSYEIEERVLFNPDNDTLEPWPVRQLYNSTDFYSGPYYAPGDDHGCTHGGDHAWKVGCCGDNRGWYQNPSNHARTTREAVHLLCKEAIKKCDLFFAWIDSMDAYGTIAEIGYAAALGKPVFIAYPMNFNTDDLWFILKFAIRHGRAKNPEIAIATFFPGIFRIEP